MTERNQVSRGRATLLLHIAERQSWAAAVQSGEYRPATLNHEGFIHCSLPEQVVPVADSLYRGRKGLVLLLIDPVQVPAEIRYEDCYESGQEFPHIYGPLPVEAVKQVLDFPPGPDGRFTLPSATTEP
jgi:uncharacterized protein (DUF952 family)